ncbi:PAC2 family protein [Candidatus Woesearchaeota archaeon]|nr:PAC2 family protein [Candidatus Woesearchaeota archaeon]
MVWKAKQFLKKLPQLKNPILVEGLPGIGNVGKVAVDFIIDELKAVKMLEFSSYSMPHSVFVNEKNLVELPKIEVFYKKFKNNRNDLIFLVGDVQPIDEESSYEFSAAVLNMLKKFKGKELITLGGIGLPAAPEKPKVFCTGTSKDFINKFKKGIKVNEKLYGIVGPIVGVTGLLIGLAQEENIDGVCLLAETYGHPLYLGIKGSQEILKILNKKLGLKLNLKQLDKEISEAEKELMKRTKQLEEVTRKSALKKIKDKEITYIG